MNIRGKTRCAAIFIFALIFIGSPATAKAPETYPEYKPNDSNVDLKALQGYEDANRAFRNKDYRQTIILSKYAIESGTLMGSDMVDMLVQRAKAYLMVGERDKAIVDLRYAERILPLEDRARDLDVALTHPELFVRNDAGELEVPNQWGSLWMFIFFHGRIRNPEEAPSRISLGNTITRALENIERKSLRSTQEEGFCLYRGFGVSKEAIGRYYKFKGDMSDIDGLDSSVTFKSGNEYSIRLDCPSKSGRSLVLSAHIHPPGGTYTPSGADFFQPEFPYGLIVSSPSSGRASLVLETSQSYEFIPKVELKSNFSTSDEKFQNNVAWAKRYTGYIQAVATGDLAYQTAEVLRYTTNREEFVRSIRDDEFSEFAFWAICKIRLVACFQREIGQADFAKLPDRLGWVETIRPERARVARIFARTAKYWLIRSILDPKALEMAESEVFDPLWFRNQIVAPGFARFNTKQTLGVADPAGALNTLGGFRKRGDNDTFYTYELSAPGWMQGTFQGCVRIGAGVVMKDSVEAETVPASSGTSRIVKGQFRLSCWLKDPANRNLSEYSQEILDGRLTTTSLEKGAHLGAKKVISIEDGAIQDAETYFKLN